MAIPAMRSSEEAALPRGLGTALHELFKPFGDVALEMPLREPMRQPPRCEQLGRLAEAGSGGTPSG